MRTVLQVSIIVPVPDFDCQPAVLESLRGAIESGRVEVLVAAGASPARQRNEAALQAKSDLLYFVDDDSRLEVDVLDTMLEQFQSCPMAVLGGPALTRVDASLFEHCVGEVMGSVFGSGAARSRSAPIGDFRAVSGEELVSCNLLVSKAWFEKLGGFDVALYPGEDVDLLKRIRNTGGSMYYSPKGVVTRGRSRAVSEVVDTFFGYAQGRGLRFFRNFRMPDLIFLLPCLFMLNLIFSAVLPSLGLKIYGLAVLIQSLFIGHKNRSVRVATICVFLFPVVHLAHGAGFLAGLLNLPMNNFSDQVEVRRFDSDTISDGA